VPSPLPDDATKRSVDATSRGQFANRERRPIAMVVHSYYDEDPRVRREAESLVDAGHAVDVFALRREDDSLEEDVAGIHVRRLGVQRHQGAGIRVYLREYLSFLVRAGWALARAHRRRHYGLVQVHSLPDFLAFAALPLRMAGVPLLLDLHEAMPEFFRSRFPRTSNPLLYRLLLIQERLSIAIATAVLTVNEAMAERLVGLGIRPDKVNVVVNRPSLARFDQTAEPTRAFAEDGSIRLVYAGALTPTYELDVAIDAIGRLASDRPDLPLVFDVYGRGDAEPGLRARAERLGVDDRVRFHGRIPIEAVPAAVARADLGLAPTRLDRFTDVSLSTKVFEYAAMGKPVVAARLPLVERTFPTATVRTYEPGDASSLAAAIVAICDDPDGRSDAVAATLAIVRERSWEHEAVGYIQLVEGLLRG
jgi:glycosyltransferase involved in cell wall biosynthesis